MLQKKTFTLNIFHIIVLQASGSKIQSESVRIVLEKKEQKAQLKLHISLL